MPIRALLFDWGGTLMQMLPGASGPMRTWPILEPTPGAADVLGALQGRYRLAIASNANESTADDVRAVMERVALDAHFEAVFTARQLGVSKPDPAYFKQVLCRLSWPAAETVMIGDDFKVDILGALGSGLQAIWYNPDGLRPLDYPPGIHQIQSMEQLVPLLGQFEGQMPAG
jgi:putative hydrolase of the HAD superfamily